LQEYPDPDLCIRTGGEQRVSNFLLWQFAYTELYFTGCFWPDFNSVHFKLALEEFAKRQRRYGSHDEDVGSDE
jgi:undecaprenyl diphosphate synthase